MEELKRHIHGILNEHLKMHDALRVAMTSTTQKSKRKEVKYAVGLFYNFFLCLFSISTHACLQE